MPLVEACISRLVIDCNQARCSDPVPPVSETTVIPGNRVAPSGRLHQPLLATFHETLEAVLKEAGRRPERPPSLLQPGLQGQTPPPHVGVIHDETAVLGL